MAIKIRRGNKADLVETNLSVGEPVIALDTKEVGIMGSSGSMVWLATKDLINVANGIAGTDSTGKVPIANVNGGVANTQKIAGIALSGDITAAQFQAAGLAAGDSSGNALNALKLAGLAASTIIDGSGNAQNALKLGGADAANFPQISSGTWTPYLYGETTAGSPVYSTHSANYYKIGNLVVIKNLKITLTSLGGMAGNIHLGGLPFSGNGFIFLHDAMNFSMASGTILYGIKINGAAGDIVKSSNSMIYIISASDLTDTFLFIGEGGMLT